MVLFFSVLRKAGQDQVGQIRKAIDARGAQVTAVTDKKSVSVVMKEKKSGNWVTTIDAARHKCIIRGGKCSSEGFVTGHNAISVVGNSAMRIKCSRFDGAGVVA